MESPTQEKRMGRKERCHKGGSWYEGRRCMLRTFFSPVVVGGEKQIRVDVSGKPLFRGIDFTGERGRKDSFT